MYGINGKTLFNTAAKDEMICISYKHTTVNNNNNQHHGAEYFWEDNTLSYSRISKRFITMHTKSH